MLSERPERATEWLEVDRSTLCASYDRQCVASTGSVLRPRRCLMEGAAMIDSDSSLNLRASDLGNLIPPSYQEPDDSQPEPNDTLAYLNNWEPPTEKEWRRATWIVARELVRGIVGSNWRVFAKLEMLSTRKQPYDR